jgi:hypothetical protein
MYGLCTERTKLQRKWTKSERKGKRSSISSLLSPDLESNGGQWVSWLHYKDARYL